MPAASIAPRRGFVVRDLVRLGELAYVHAGRGTERRHLTFKPEEVENFVKRHTTREHYYSLGPKSVRYGTRKGLMSWRWSRLRVVISRH